MRVFKDQYIVMSMNEGTGCAEAFGPFRTYKEAYQWAEQNIAEDCSWHVKVLYDPTGRQEKE